VVIGIVAIVGLYALPKVVVDNEGWVGDVEFSQENLHHQSEAADPLAYA